MQRSFFVIIFSLILVGAFLFSANSLKANTNGTNVVISQIQIGESGTGNTTKEFVELYNPTNAAIDLSGWDLRRKTNTEGATPQNLVNNIDLTIPAFSYLLIASPEFTHAVTPDKTYTTSTRLSPDHTVYLFNNEAVVIDKVGMGNANDPEATAIANPENNGSILRKASANSTAQTLQTGGSEATAGNGHDTDDSANDFVLLTMSLPRNSAVTVPTTTSGPTIAPTTNPTTEPTNVPNSTNTPTPTPTKTPTPTPTARPTNSPTATPTVTTFPFPTITIPTVPVTPSPTTSPTPTPEIINDISFPGFRLICTRTSQTISIFGVQVRLPKTIQCRVERQSMILQSINHI